jgi:hypothetical protein
MRKGLVKDKQLSKTIQRKAFDSLNAVDKKRVEGVFKEFTGCSSATFYRILNGKRPVRPHEKSKFEELLKVRIINK